jgi:ribosomal protein S18 acetylase RimI-like enzyme
LLCPAQNLTLLHASLDLGFRPYDLRIELSRPLEPHHAQPPVEVRDARSEEQAALETLCRARMGNTRFWADPHFPKERVESLYAEWLRRGMTTSPERRTLVIDGAEGFVVCRFDTDRNEGTIELIGVSAEMEGSGISDSLVTGALQSFAEAGLAKTVVVTQGRNIAAQRLYQRHGYQTSGMGYWLHRWVTASS